MYARASHMESIVCHCLGDMAMRMRKVLTRLWWICVRVRHLLLLLFSIFKTSVTVFHSKDLPEDQ